MSDQFKKAFKFGALYHGTVSGRFQSEVPNLQNLPKDGFDYGEMELRLIAMTFPGEDGIGADVYQIHDEFVAEVKERAIGASPLLEAPYGLAADILKSEDVIYNNGARSHRAKVIQFDANKDSAEIQFEEKGLIPPTMWVPITHIRHAWGGSVVNAATHCPTCRVQWKETMLARFSVWDCPSCGAKKEDHAR